VINKFSKQESGGQQYGKEEICGDPWTKKDLQEIVLSVTLEMKGQGREQIKNSAEGKNRSNKRIKLWETARNRVTEPKWKSLKSQSEIEKKG